MKKDKKISIVVPTKNEGAGIERIIKTLKKYSNDIIIIDAHSNDGTKEISKKLGARFYLDHGLGKGEAVRLGLKKAKNDLIVIFDGDGSPNPKDIPKLTNNLTKTNSDLVITSRRLGGSDDFDLHLNGIIRTMGSDFMAYLVNKKFGTNISDILYNFRAIKKKSALKLKLNANGFDIEQEMLINALKNKLKVSEIPSHEFRRKWGKSKLSTWHGIILLGKLIKSLVSK